MVSPSSIPGHKTPILREWMPELEALRGIAALMVIAQHVRYWSGLESTIFDRFRVGEWGNWGVIYFFALSGFLITQQWIQKKDQVGDLRSFYRRRFFRIAPLCYMVVLFGMGLSIYQGRVFSWIDIVMLLLFLGNISSMAHGTRLFEPFLPLWAVSVEIHFYLIWPVLLRRVKPMRMFRLCTVLILFAVVVRALIYEWVANAKAWNHYFTLSRMDVFAMGALLALLIHLKKVNSYNIKKTAWFCTGVSCVMYVLLRGELWSLLGIKQAILAACITSGMFMTIAYRDHPVVSKWLANPVLIFLGKRSYGIYLVHVFVIAVWTKGMTDLKLNHSYLLQLAIVILVSTSVASFLWRWFECPLRSFSRRSTEKH